MEEKKFDLETSSKISSEKIKQIANKEKNNLKILMILISISCFIMLISMLMSFVYGETGIGIFALIFLLPFLAILIYSIIIYTTRTEIEWFKKGAKEEADILDVEFYILKQKHIIDDNFVLSKIIDIISSYNHSDKILIDNVNRKFIYNKGKEYSKAYNFSDIINYEVYENGKSQVQGRAGSALIGGAFFGLGGLIVGSSMSRNINEKCNQLKLIIRLNDFDCPQIMITYVDNVDWDKSGWMYRNMKENMQAVCSMLEYMLNEKTLEQSSTVKQVEKTSEQKSQKEQLQELKEMLDDGLITQEDFEQKKKQILGL